MARPTNARTTNAHPASSLTDYGVTVGLIAVLALGAVAVVGSSSEKIYCKAGNALTQVTGGAGDPDCGVGSGSGAGASETAPDTEPDSFAFLAQDAMTPSTLVVSNLVTLSGFDAAATVALVAGDPLNTTALTPSAIEMSVDGGSFGPAPATLSPGASVQLRFILTDAGAAAHAATLTVGGVSAAFTATTLQPNRAPVFATAPDMGSIQFGPAPVLGVQAADADGDALAYALDPADAAAYPFLTVDPASGAIGVDFTTLDTTNFVANPAALFSVTVTDDAAAPLSASRDFSLTIGLPADCDALLDIVPTLADGPAGIDPRLLPGAGTGVSGPVQSWCDVEGQDAWTLTMIARGDNTLPGSAGTGDLESLVQTAVWKLDDETMAALGDQSRIDGAVAPYFVSYEGKAWSPDFGWLAQNATPFAVASFVDNDPANEPAPMCRLTGVPGWHRGRGFDVADCLQVRPDFSVGDERLSSGDRLVWARRSGEIAALTDLPPRWMVTSGEQSVLYTDIPFVHLTFDLGTLAEDPEAGALSYTLLGASGGVAASISGSTLNVSHGGSVDPDRQEVLVISTQDAAGQRALQHFFIEGAALTAMPASCDDIYDRLEAQSLLSHVAATQFPAVIDPDGAGAQPPQNVYCHFETAGALAGGWTVVAFQREDAPETNWNAGIIANRDFGAYFNSSLALSAGQIPAHTATAFGRRFLANGQPANAIEILDAVALTYTAGDIPVTGAVGLVNTGTVYDIQRDTVTTYNEFDPDPGSFATNAGGQFANGLTFDVRAMTPSIPDDGQANAEFTWAFAPSVVSQNIRGFSYAGAFMSENNTSNANPGLNFGWIVMVR